MSVYKSKTLAGVYTPGAWVVVDGYQYRVESVNHLADGLEVVCREIPRV